MKPEIERLQEYFRELSYNERSKIVMRPERLIETRDHIKLCDYIAETSAEKMLLVRTAQLWERCREFWSRYKWTDEDTEIPQLTIQTKVNEADEAEIRAASRTPVKAEAPSNTPKKPWYNDMSENDKEFLKLLRITRDDDEHA